VVVYSTTQLLLLRHIVWWLSTVLHSLCGCLQYYTAAAVPPCSVVVVYRTTQLMWLSTVLHSLCGCLQYYTAAAVAPCSVVVVYSTTQLLLFRHIVWWLSTVLHSLCGCLLHYKAAVLLDITLCSLVLVCLLNNITWTR